MIWQRYPLRALIVVAVVLQAYLLALLLYWRHHPDGISNFFQPPVFDVTPLYAIWGYYVISSLMLTCCLFLYSGTKKYVYIVVLFVFCFSIPIFSGLAWLLLLMHFDRDDDIQKGSQHLHDSAFDLLSEKSTEHDIADSLHEISSIDIQNPFRKYSGLIGVINNRMASVQDRVSALLATRGLMDLKAIPLLKQAINDSDDEVRLLAFSLLERREKQLLDNIRTLESSRELTRADKIELGKLYKKLINSGLYEGGMKQYYENIYQEQYSNI